MRRWVTAAVALALVACGGGGDDEADDERVDVVASLYPLAEAARQVGGSRVDVVDLTPAGAEPHDLELTTKQLERIEDADIVIVLGRDFQPAVEEVADRGGEKIVILDELGLDDVRDPHVWLDPALMQDVVAAVARALADADPSGRAAYERNARAYEQDLDALDETYARGLANCERHTIVTAHDAFSRLAARYGLEQEAIAGISPDEEPSADRIAQLSDIARRDGVTTIFTEELVSPEVAETLAREAGGLAVEVLSPIEGLTDQERERGADYMSLMRENLAKLQRALGCA